jgi:toxin ParE1/3/4
MTPSVSSEADWELTREAVFYAREGGAELGNAFISEFERALSLLCANPELGVRWRNSRRRFPLRKFPFSIIYFTRGSELRVIALAHHSRKPDYWSGRKVRTARNAQIGAQHAVAVEPQQRRCRCLGPRSAGGGRRVEGNGRRAISE